MLGKTESLVAAMRSAHKPAPRTHTPTDKCTPLVAPNRFDTTHPCFLSQPTCVQGPTRLNAQHHCPARVPPRCDPRATTCEMPAARVCRQETHSKCPRKRGGGGAAEGWPAWLNAAWFQCCRTRCSARGMPAVMRLRESDATVFVQYVHCYSCSLTPCKSSHYVWEIVGT